MGAGAPYGNKNAEKWTLRISVEFYKKCIELTNEREEVIVNGNPVNGYKYDFIGEIAGELGTYKQVFDHLLKRFPTLKRLYNQFHTNIERNCYCNGKKGTIKEASAIMNLKSNHKWTDRQETNIPELRQIKGITFE